MTVSSNYLNYVLEQFAPFAKVRARRMFGGIGLYADELFFGLIDNDVLYLKVGDNNRAAYQARHCEPLRPLARDPDAFTMSYYAVPAEIIEEAEELQAWARKSLEVALGARKPAVRKKTTRESRRTRSTRSRS